MQSNLSNKLKMFRISKPIKRILNFAGGVFLAGILLFFAFLKYQNGWRDINKADKYDGIIEKKGITSYLTSTSGRYRSSLTKKAFYLKLTGLNETLAVYNPEQNYTSLNTSLYIGDKIKIFYNRSKSTNNLNLEIFQIEKNNKLVLNPKDFIKRERTIFFLTLIGGIALMILTYYQNKQFNSKIK